MSRLGSWGVGCNWGVSGVSVRLALTLIVQFVVVQFECCIPAKELDALGPGGAFVLAWTPIG